MDLTCFRCGYHHDSREREPVQGYATLHLRVPSGFTQVLTVSQAPELADFLADVQTNPNVTSVILREQPDDRAVFLKGQPTGTTLTDVEADALKRLLAPSGHVIQAADEHHLYVREGEQSGLRILSLWRGASGLSVSLPEDHPELVTVCGGLITLHGDVAAALQLA